MSTSLTRVVDAWFDKLPGAQRARAHELRGIILAAAPTLSQAVKWGNLVFARSGANLLAIVVHREHINLQVFNGALLAARFPQLAGSGKGMRHLSIRDDEVIDAQLVQAITRACVGIGNDGTTACVE